LMNLDRPWLHRLEITVVFDVGANRGQFAASAAIAFPNARIVSVEPLPDCYQALCELAKRYPNITPVNAGVGREAGSLTINRNEYTDSSSFRIMEEEHRVQFPFTSAPTEPLVAEVRTLDTIAQLHGRRGPTLVKIDVQGFEDEVIRGGPTTLSAAAAVIVEVSFVPLYRGAPSFDQIYKMLRELGLEFAGCFDQLIGPLDGRILQGDALFLRRT
jgi:FkbM family methyltransferase